MSREYCMCKRVKDYGICYKHQVVSNGTYTVNLTTRYNRKEE
jgi:hypothetical protein